MLRNFYFTQEHKFNSMLPPPGFIYVYVYFKQQSLGSLFLILV